jgi:hypothetical protein
MPQKMAGLAEWIGRLLRTKLKAKPQPYREYREAKKSK